eukprot:90761-Rhodomonas_salina.1
MALARLASLAATATALLMQFTGLVWLAVAVAGLARRGGFKLAYSGPKLFQTSPSILSKNA